VALVTPAVAAAELAAAATAAAGETTATTTAAAAAASEVMQAVTAFKSFTTVATLFSQQWGSDISAITHWWI
jgi:hypothetical protein